MFNVNLHSKKLNKKIKIIIMKINKKLSIDNKQSKQTIIINLNNSKHIIWNKRRRFGI